MERPGASSNTSSSIPQCCCGNVNCAFLAHNSTLLEGLERDVSKAAQLGQALLVRHEAYVADSEQERRQMSAAIEHLEKEKMELEQRNADTIKANRDLLDQLEQLNSAVADSDAQVKALTDTLHSTEEEIQRLSLLAARTQSLERQLIDLEHEQAQLQGSLEDKADDERSAVQRWRRAEQIIGDLQDQLDRIEKEAREERERHVEIVARMERRVAVDKELGAHEGRLRVKTGQEKGGTNVVSHFVKDILLDNANLQHGILELREMLLNSNEEVEHLREQLKVHQPISPTLAKVPTPSLQKELGGEPMLNQELHIHHHYHSPVPRKEPIKVQHRRTRKKRLSVASAHFAPPISDPSSSAAILSQTAVTVPPNMNRWSNATTLADSSIPGSPLSMSYRGSVYDRVFSDVAYDSSRPTSPSDSLDLTSPMFGPTRSRDDISSKDNPFRHRKRLSQSLKPPSLSTIRSSSTPICLSAKSSPTTAIISPQNSLSDHVFALSPSLHGIIPEEENEGTATPDTNSLLSPLPRETDTDGDFERFISPTTQFRPPLRRYASHESLISVSGMDIHTLQSRPSQLLLSSSPSFASPSATGSQPVLTPWTATATASMAARTEDRRALSRDLLYSSLANTQRRGVSTPQNRSASQGLGQKVGGWVFGKWGAMPTSSRAVSSSLPQTQTGVVDLHPPSPSPSPSSASSSKQRVQVDDTTPTKLKPKDQALPSKSHKESREREIRLRPPGVNQSGPIWGFFDVPPTPTKVVVTDFDREALGEALAEMES
ncbi:hypothetical protein P154DRAFT_523959 [Amniculicola lignicola CBS 123094]|uniref:Uncharacterized protein n=1 Tax=Amniculicola lignicola CBS 123094 TaxID=1392246 RepID=A0A6A5WC26_9PLEO|nr:hypothetical protein P154DRAFT_523959 [Amniculicola lignicola CBS 123094]